MKKKKILLIVLPIILIIVGLAIGATLYFTTDLFKSNEQLFSKYFMQNGELFSIIENENAKAQSEFKTNNIQWQEACQQLCKTEATHRRLML